MQSIQAAAQDILIDALRNAHALEAQALAIMEPQVDRLEHYPEVADRIRQHIDETRGQQVRIEDLLEQLGSDRSGWKDFVTRAIGGIASSMHMPMMDEILKNSFANYAFEHFEIAAYKALVVIGEAAGQPGAVAVARTNLAEEEAMAKWLEQHLTPTTQRFIELTAREERASR